MLDLHQFIALFQGRPVPEDLIRLGGFQNVVKTQYTQSLWLTDHEKRGLEAGWSTDPAFLERLVAFGVANGSGSFYALWNPDDGSEPAEWPVVVFGDEGGEWVIARNVRELLQLSGLDVEPYVDHESAYFFVDEDEEDEDKYASDAIEDYREWLREVAQLDPLADPDPVVERARAQWQAQFDAWKAPYLDGR